MAGYVLYIIIALISCFVAFSVRDREGHELANRIRLAIIFWILFLASALRIYTGNDYRTYIYHFHDSYRDIFVVTEPGFNAVAKYVYKFFDEEYFLVLFAIFAFVTILFFLKALYEQSRDFGMSFMLFMAYGLYFQTYNTVRYYMALAIVFYAMRFVRDRQYVKFLIAVLVAALFHKTAIAVLLIYPICRMRWQIYHYVLIVMAGISGLVFKSQYMELFVRLYPSYKNEPEYLASGGMSIINILRVAAVIAFAIAIMILCRKKKEQEKNEAVRFYFQVNVAALVLYLCFSFVPFLSRLGYYLIISQVLLIPELIRMSESLKLNVKKVLVAGVTLCAAAYFGMFMYKATAENVKILPYSTWLTYDSSDMIGYPEPEQYILIRE
ncbi:MAG: EpsG family protein [Lachnospiraceae bacterium]|nr:EpsG family protein [Lachnospiraceae bacterium]